MATMREILRKYGIAPEIPLTVYRGCSTMEVCRRYLEGGWDDVLDSEVLNWGRDPEGHSIIFELKD
jgi:hypothetical protein